MELAKAIEDEAATVELARATVQGIQGAPARVVDLLEDEIVVKWEVPLTTVAPGLSTLASSEVYDAVIRSYTEMRVQPIGAALATVTPDFPDEP